MTGSFDYIVVGAGSSGTAIAARLAERGDARVLLLEAGERRHREFWVRTPIGIAKLLGSARHVWPFRTAPQASLAGQSLYWPRGRMLGGSSGVNGVIYVRGDPAEYDHWASLGNEGWSHADLLPCFRRLERTGIGDARWRGREGPVHVSNVADDPDPLSDAFISACIEAGIPAAADYNGEHYEGVSYLQLNTRKGRRCDSVTAYLEGRRLDALHVEPGALVQRVLLDGRRATGVEFRREGTVHRVLAAREVILAAGPIKSPQLLELSGIGQAERLRALGIPVVHDLPGVGENLVDHLQTRLTFSAPGVRSLNTIVGRRARELSMGLQYLLTGRGLMATPSFTAHALARTAAEPDRPSVKIQLGHLSGKDRFEQAGAGGSGLDPFPGFLLGVFPLRPRSRGSVHASSPDPHHDPVIDPRYLSEPHDRAVSLAGIRLARRIAAQPALARLIREETRPGPARASDEELLAYYRESGQSSYHPVGTCRMGTDAGAVVDPHLRVHGIERLRVADSSIMPSLPASNTHAPSVMVGEKAAELVLARQET